MYLLLGFICLGRKEKPQPSRTQLNRRKGIFKNDIYYFLPFIEQIYSNQLIFEQIFPNSISKGFQRKGNKGLVGPVFAGSFSQGNLFQDSQKHQIFEINVALHFFFFIAQYFFLIPLISLPGDVNDGGTFETCFLWVSFTQELTEMFKWSLLEKSQQFATRPGGLDCPKQLCCL